MRGTRSIAGAAALGFVIACALPALAQTTAQPTDISPLATQIGTLLADPKVEGAHWGISVTQLDGTSIYALNDAQLFHPESNVKLFTTAAALGLLNKDIYYTNAWLQGDITTPGTVKGNIALYGNGDSFLSDTPEHYVAHTPHSSPPTLARLDELAANLAAQLVKPGVTKSTAR